MRLRVALPLAAVLGPVLASVLVSALVLSVLALRVADHDHAERVAALRSGLEEEAAALARTVERSLAEAVEKGREGAVVGFARDGRWLGDRFGGAPGETFGDTFGDAPGDALHGTSLDADAEPIGEPSEDERRQETRYYGLAVRGGESWEIIRRDPERAVDAYAFYLPRIRSRELRARLHLRTARTLLGEEARARGLDRRLGTRILEALREGAGGLRTEEGLPIDRVAAVLLGEDDRALVERLAAMRALEEAVRAHPEILAERRAVAGEGYVLVAEDAAREEGGETPQGAEAAGPARAIRRVPWSAPPLEGALTETLSSEASVRDGSPSDAHPSEANRLLARWVFWGVAVGGVAADRTADRTAARPEGANDAGRARDHARAVVRAGDGGEVVGAVEVEDPRLPARLAALGRARNVRRALVGALLVVALAGGGALLHLVRRERELSRLRERLLRNVSHELRTPVTSIRLFAELLAEDGLGPEETRRFAGLLREETRRLGGVFEDFADLAGTGGARSPPALEPVDLRATLREVAAGFAVRAEAEGVRFVTAGLEGGARDGREVGDAPREGGGLDDGSVEGGPLDAVVTTSGGAVERIVRNLLDNALKHGRGDDPEVRLRLALDDRGASISVADTGRGIPRAERERIFEELHRVCYDDYAVRGSGLGLAIARRLARSLGGDVTVESEEGRGSTFTLRLPREVPHGEGTQASRGDDPRRADAGFQGR